MPEFMLDSRQKMPFIQFDRFAVQRTAQVGIGGTLQLPTIFLKAVEVRMNMVCGVDDKRSVFADDELVQTDDRQRAANPVDDVAQHLVRGVRIPEVVDYARKLVDARRASAVENQIRQ